MLLDDEQVRKFICNGFLVLSPDVPVAIHGEIERKIRFSVEREFAMGNNILPRVPELYKVLESDVVDGALTSLLGEDHLLHPHRAIHSSCPLEDIPEDLEHDSNGPPMGKGSMAGSGWHQDAQSPLSRARYHTPRHIIMFYFPHDTPQKMGPTRIQAGSYLFARPGPPRHIVFPDHLEAGTVVLVHFDMVHAAFPNLTDRTRYMIKFVFSRTSYPDGASWNNTSVEWKKPLACLVDEPLDPVWASIWSWMRGKQHEDSGCEDIEALRRLIEQLDDENQIKRLNAIYRLGGAGEAVCGMLLDWLLNLRGSGRECRKLLKRDEETVPIDAPCREPRWNERAIVMEDATYALARMGPVAVGVAQSLVRTGDPWLQVNAAYILGETHTGLAVILLSDLLGSEHQQVVRQALDALGTLGLASNRALPEIERLLTQSNPNWQQAEVMRGWTAEDQVRLNAVFSLVNLCDCVGTDLVEVERLLIISLDDKNGYVPVVACEGLSRIGTRSALRACVNQLKQQQWDSSLRGGQKLY